MFESKAGVFFIAGVGFFLLAFLGNGVVPMLMYKDRPEVTAEQLVAGIPGVRIVDPGRAGAADEIGVEVDALDGAAREEEIARMLAGAQVTEAARAAAQSLLTSETEG
mgnify:CR=1 FL=1